MSLPLNMLSRLVITFLPRSKRLLISWLQSPSAVILEPKFSGSVAKTRPVLCDPMNCSTQGFPVLHYLPEFAETMYIESVMPFNRRCLILCCPLLLLPSIFPSIRVLSNGSVLCIRWPKYQTFSFIISPFNEYSGLISFRINWFNLLAVSPRDSQESSLSHLESINSSVFILLYGPTCISVHDYWKSRRFDYKDLCWQSDVFF